LPARIFDKGCQAGLGVNTWFPSINGNQKKRLPVAGGGLLCCVSVFFLLVYQVGGKLPLTIISGAFIS
jgi:hypothetical protein